MFISTFGALGVNPSLNVVAAQNTVAGTPGFLSIPPNTLVTGMAVAPNGTAAFAGGFGGNTLVFAMSTSAAAPPASAMLKQFLVGVIPVAMVVSPDSSKLYIAGGTQRIEVYDTASYSRLNAFNADFNVNALAVSPDGMTLYASANPNLATQGVMLIDPVAGVVNSRIPVGTAKSQLAEMLINGDGTRLYIRDSGLNVVQVIDPTSLTPAIGTITLPPGFRSFALDPTGTLLYVLGTNPAIPFPSVQLFEYDTASLTLAATYPLPGNDGNFIAMPPAAPMPANVITVTPASSELYAGESVQLTVTGAQPSDVPTWTLAPGSPGSLSSTTGATVTYTAPGAVASFQVAQVQVMVASAPNPAVASIVLDAPLSLTLALESPVTSPLAPGGTQKLLANLAYARTSKLTWSLSPGAPGTLSPTGNPYEQVFTYSGPPVTAPTDIIVTVTSQQDNTTSAQQTIRLAPKP
jgi:hypothetical protein